MKTRTPFFALALVALLVGSTGCSTLAKTWRGLIGKSEPKDEEKHQGNDGPSFSQQAEMMPARERKYKRVTKDNFADDSNIEENAGSLWKREGQGSYLFSENNLRTVGDILNVQVEGRAAENLGAKVTLIKQALAKIEAPLRPKRAPATQRQRPKPGSGDGSQQGQDNQQAQQGDQKTDSGQVAGGEKPKEEQKFDHVPCRIVEKNQDGSYRIKGSQTLLLGKREYRVIVTGLVRPEDVSQALVSSTKVIDSKFDLVATNKEVRGVQVP
jgi:flagellar L-ring protein precursor FlgH